MLACLQRGEADEAEHWLKLAALDQPPEPAAVYTPDLAARAEIALARGLTEVGLGLWRQALDKLREDSARLTGDPFMDPWSLELRSAALAAHALHGRLAPVAAGLAAELRAEVLAKLSDPAGSPAGPGPVEPPGYGTALLALGLAGVAAGDKGAVKLVALAERTPVVRQFPSLSSARSRHLAEHADRAAYADAGSEYAALGPGRAAGAGGAGAAQRRGSRLNRAVDQR
ncbi:AfsR/SARP family transcriptional regulator OS=Streptomyces fumanus OX=67302 GN=GCM10018772_11460 PE=3 SV=1 [Streptomyces fumanus]